MHPMQLHVIYSWFFDVSYGEIVDISCMNPFFLFQICVNNFITILHLTNYCQIIACWTDIASSWYRHICMVVTSSWKMLSTLIVEALFFYLEIPLGLIKNHRTTNSPFDRIQPRTIEIPNHEETKGPLLIYRSYIYAWGLHYLVRKTIHLLGETQTFTKLINV